MAMAGGAPGTDHGPDDIPEEFVEPRRSMIFSELDRENKLRARALELLGLGGLAQSPLDGSLLGGYNKEKAGAAHEAMSLADPDIRDALEEELSKAPPPDEPEKDRIAEFREQAIALKKKARKGAYASPMDFLNETDAQ
jgi:hypothetical protein